MGLELAQLLTTNHKCMCFDSMSLLVSKSTVLDRSQSIETGRGFKSHMILTLYLESKNLSTTFVYLYIYISASISIYLSIYLSISIYLYIYIYKPFFGIDKLLFDTFVWVTVSMHTMLFFLSIFMTVFFFFIV